MVRSTGTKSADILLARIAMVSLCAALGEALSSRDAYLQLVSHAHPIRMRTGRAGHMGPSCPFWCRVVLSKIGRSWLHGSCGSRNCSPQSGYRIRDVACNEERRKLLPWAGSGTY